MHKREGAGRFPGRASSLAEKLRRRVVRFIRTEALRRDSRLVLIGLLEPVAAVAHGESASGRGVTSIAKPRPYSADGLAMSFSAALRSLPP
jgi:hypothetical protein